MITRTPVRLQRLLVCTLGFSLLSFAAEAQTTIPPCPLQSENQFTVVQTDPLLRAGVTAYEHNRLSDADSLLRRATRISKSAAEAQYWLARLKMDDRVNSPAGARLYLRRALDLEPENIRFIEERLRQLNSGNPFFSGSESDRQWWAARILEIDSTNATAFENIGLDSMDQYYYYRALLGTNSNDKLSRMMDEARARTLGSLDQALTFDPCRRHVYSALIRFHFDHKDFESALRLTDLMQNTYPNESETWLFSGVTDYFLGNLDEADQYFNAAFRLMTVNEKEAYAQYAFLLSETERFQSESDPEFLSAYWTANRTRYLTEVNERLLSHYARLVYSDLIYPYWRDYATDEWLITPGEMIIRYGLPIGNYTYHGNLETKTGVPVAGSRYMTLVFRGRSFRFTDKFRSGHYFLADDKGTLDLTDARSEIFRTPQAYSFEGPARKVDIPYLVSVFKPEADFGVRQSSGAESDVYISLGIPLRATGTDTTTFARVLDASNRVTLDQLFLTLGSFLIDPAGSVVTQKKQSLYGLSDRSVLNTSGGTLWTATHKLSAVPADYRISVEFETFSKDVLGVTPGQITVRSFDSDSLDLSDILLAYLVEEWDRDLQAPAHIIRRNDLAIEPAPWTVFSPSQPIYVYFEMYGLDQRANGQTRIEIEVALIPDQDEGGVSGFIDRILGGEDQEGVAVRVDYTGNSPDDFQYIIVDASEQPGGQYKLILRIRDLVSGTVRQTQRTVFLEDQ